MVWSRSTGSGTCQREIFPDVRDSCRRLSPRTGSKSVPCDARDSDLIHDAENCCWAVVLWPIRMATAFVNVPKAACAQSGRNVAIHNQARLLGCAIENSRNVMKLAVTQIGRRQRDLSSLLRRKLDPPNIVSRNRGNFRRLAPNPASKEPRRLSGSLCRRSRQDPNRSPRLRGRTPRT